ncbi:MAG: hypothetical protein HY420_03415, partial [Candidatus Kerfeldbacteria bacterium]|nr:hypothetical protein [Candidatus Kerfeldbacteria bacterium]
MVESQLSIQTQTRVSASVVVSASAMVAVSVVAIGFDFAVFAGIQIQQLQQNIAAGRPFTCTTLPQPQPAFYSERLNPASASIPIRPLVPALASARSQLLNASARNDRAQTIVAARSYKESVVKVMQQDAAAALVDDPTVGSILTTRAQGCAPLYQVLTGRLSGMHIDDIEDLERSESLFWLSTASGNYRVHFAHGFYDDDLGGATVRLRGKVLDGHIVVDGTSRFPGNGGLGTGYDIIERPKNPPTLGEQRFHVISFQYANHVVDDTTMSTFQEQVRQMFLERLPDFYQEVSYQQMSISAQFYGPYQIAGTADEAYLANEYFERILAAAVASGDLQMYDGMRIAFIYPPGGSGRTFGSWGTYQFVKGFSFYPQPIRMSYMAIGAEYIDQENSKSLGTVAHEAGHMFGHLHAGLLLCGEDPIGIGCATETYGDPFDVMGYSLNQPGHFSAPKKYFSGWLDDSTAPIAQPGKKYTLSAYELAQPLAGTVRALRIPWTPDGRDALTIEYRQPIGYDAHFDRLSRNVYDGVLLHVPETYRKTEAKTGGGSFSSTLLVNGGASPSSLTREYPVAPAWEWEQGTFHDLVTNANISLLGPPNPLTQTVDVDISYRFADHFPPAVAILEPSGINVGRGIVTVSAVATDAETGVDHVDFYHNTGSALTKLGTAMQEPYQVLWDTTQLEEAHELLAVAYDRAGAEFDLPGNRMVSQPRDVLIWPGADEFLFGVSVLEPLKSAQVPQRFSVVLGISASEASPLRRVYVEFSTRVDLSENLRTLHSTWDCASPTPGRCVIEVTLAPGFYDLSPYVVDARGNTYLQD